MRSRVATAAATKEGAVNTEIRETRRRIRTTEAQDHAGQRVKMAGWLHRLRRLGAISFLVLRDGYSLVRCRRHHSRGVDSCQRKRALRIQAGWLGANQDALVSNPVVPAKG